MEINLANMKTISYLMQYNELQPPDFNYFFLIPPNKFFNLQQFRNKTILLANDKLFTIIHKKALQLKNRRASFINAASRLRLT